MQQWLSSSTSPGSEVSVVQIQREVYLKTPWYQPLYIPCTFLFQVKAYLRTFLGCLYYFDARCKIIGVVRLCSSNHRDAHLLRNELRSMAYTRVSWIIHILLENLYYTCITTTEAKRFGSESLYLWLCTGLCNSVPRYFLWLLKSLGPLTSTR